MNNIITGNSTCWTAGGGGIRCFVNNWDAYEAGGIYSYKSSAKIANCILWGNGDDLYGCQATCSCIENQDPGEGNIHENPRFANPSVGDFHLRPTSPCINAGNNRAVDLPIADLDGEYRPFGSAVDIGADEYVDQDSDGLPDYWEIQSFGQLWFGPNDDPDNDGLSNADELANRTQANNLDSDNDGQSDGRETAAGADPLNPESFFKVLGISVNGEAVVVECSSVPGRAYQLFSSADLRGWVRVTSPSIAYRSSVSLIHIGAVPQRCFYRVLVLP